MTYLFVLGALFLAELLYFNIAEKFNIIDKPNQRSSHTSITLRGGGIVFYLAVLIFFFVSDFEYPWFFLGLTLMTGVSFLDDICTLSNKVRLLVHFTSVVLMTVELEVFNMPWYIYILGFIVVVGVINAYNFMDGINGMTACYSLSVGGLLMLVNSNIGFISQDLLLYSVFGLLVFAFFNFRTKAKCFAGDVGSVSISYILLFCVGSLILKTGNLIYFLFLAVYGVDAVWTILQRLYLRENIFEAHRSHLYQYLGNEVGMSSLVVSFIYGFVQLLIGLAVIQFVDRDSGAQFAFSVAVLGGLSVAYILLKAWVLKRFVVTE